MSKVYDENSDNNAFTNILNELLNDSESVIDNPDWDFAYEMIEHISNADIDKNFHYGGTYQFTLLMLAAEIGNIKMAQMLLDKGANVNQTQGDDLSVICLASCEPNNVDMIKFLLENGADPNTSNLFGASPQAIAINNDYLDLLEFLLEDGTADMSIKCYNFSSVIDFALSKNNSKVINLLKHYKYID